MYLTPIVKFSLIFIAYTHFLRKCGIVMKEAQPSYNSLPQNNRNMPAWLEQLFGARFPSDMLSLFEDNAAEKDNIAAFLLNRPSLLISFLKQFISADQLVKLFKLIPSIHLKTIIELIYQEGIFLHYIKSFGYAGVTTFLQSPYASQLELPILNMLLSSEIVLTQLLIQSDFELIHHFPMHRTAILYHVCSKEEVLAKITAKVCKFRSLRMNEYTILLEHIAKKENLIQLFMTQPSRDIYRLIDNIPAMPDPILNSFIDLYPFCQQNPISRPLLKGFMLNSKSLVFKQLSRKDVGIEILTLISRPDFLDQGSTNLCGMASILYLWIKNDPLRFLIDVLELFETGSSSDLLLKASQRSLSHETDPSLAILSALKNATTILPCDKRLLFFENISNLVSYTTPKEMAQLLRKIGFIDIEEAYSFCGSDGKSLGTFHRFLLGGIYSDVHAVEDNIRDSIKDLIVAFKKGKSIILALEYDLAAEIMRKLKPEEKLSFLGVEISHYCNLENIELKNGAVQIKISTWGESSSATIPLHTFIDGYRGFLAAGYTQRGDEVNQKSEGSSTHITHT